VGPDYVPPETTVPQAWHSVLDEGLTEQTPAPETLASWWTTLDDPTLDSLTERAVSGNLDLKEAQARVRQARAARGIAKASLMPTVNASGSDKWTRSGGGEGTGRTTELHSVGFDAGWEMDIFGGTRRSIEAAEVDLQATEAGLHDTLVTLLSEVALNYVELRVYQAQLTSVQASLAAQEETYQLTVWQNEARLSDELAVHQARYNLENTRSQIPDLQTALNEAMNRIAVLLGEQPGRLHDELSEPKPIPVCSEQIAIGVPGDTLRQRPDVRQAERQLAAQTARIGIAEAERYPRFSLAGTIGAQALSLISGTSSSVSGGPQMTWAVFDGGAIRQNIEQQSALQQQYLFQYEAAILNALEEAENAIASYVNEHDKRRSLEMATEAARNAAELARYEYEAGMTDFSNVLDAQRSLLSFENQLAQSNGTVTSSLIRLYKALGGGWTPTAFTDSHPRDTEIPHDIDS
jgi:NodT family efflux transporter outer membrane factor (OMF) lipoprotein